MAGGNHDGFISFVLSSFSRLDWKMEFYRFLIGKNLARGPDSN